MVTGNYKEMGYEGYEKVTVPLHDYLLTGNLLSRILRSCLLPSSG